jgi:hypothetical protein
MNEIVARMGGNNLENLLSVDGNKYDIIVKSVVTEAVRRLEMFLLEEC